MVDSARDAPQGVGHDVFVSYSRDDQDRVRRLVDALDAVGWSVFWDREVPAGLRWRDYIGSALTQARCVVVVWSQSSIQKQYVAEEADDGLQRRALVPVLIDPVLPPSGFRSVHAADLSRWSGHDNDPAWAGFVEDLQRFLGAPPRRPGPPSPSLATPSAPSLPASPRDDGNRAPADDDGLGQPADDRRRPGSGAHPNGAERGPVGTGVAGTPPTDEPRRRLRRHAVGIGTVAGLLVAGLLAWLWWSAATGTLEEAPRINTTPAATQAAGTADAADAASAAAADGGVTAAGTGPAVPPASTPTSAPAPAPASRPAPVPARQTPAATPALDRRCGELLERQQLGETLGTADQQYYKSRCAGR